MLCKSYILATLIRIAIGSNNIHNLATSNIVWQNVYDLARKQGVLAIAFDGLMKLFEQDKEFAKSFPQSLKLQWINAVFSIEQRYEKQLKVCTKLTNEWEKQGIKTLCLKGFAFSSYYPIPSHRECGDFDCYLYDNYSKGNDIAQQLGAKVDDNWYKHSEIFYHKVMIENHRYIVAVRSGKKTKELHKLLDNIAQSEGTEPIFNTKIEMPSAMFNALFMNYHSLEHFLSEGIHLRHILDWALFIKKEQSNFDWSRFYHLCEEYNMRAFVDCITTIAVQFFKIQIVNPQITITSPYAKRVLISIIEDDSAIFSQNIGAWHKRIMLIRNIFSSHWKYKAFSQQGILSKLTSLVWGFLTHPEEQD